MPGVISMHKAFPEETMTTSQSIPSYISKKDGWRWEVEGFPSFGVHQNTVVPFLLCLRASVPVVNTVDLSENKRNVISQSFQD